MINWLASFGESGEGGVTRLLYSKPWLSAQQSLKEKMEDWGIEPYFDDAGNLFGRIEGISLICTGLLCHFSHFQQKMSGFVTFMPMFIFHVTSKIVFI
ncbi:hypothetical protein DT075_11180 [Bacillus licheniformis]|nr:hypothetical protein DT075_11180 [Bacillus licheniformis]